MSVEDTIGDMKFVFRCLLKHRTLYYDPTFAGKIVYAAGALYNYRIRLRVLPYNEYGDDGNDESEESEVDEDPDAGDDTDNDTEIDVPKLTGTKTEI